MTILRERIADATRARTDLLDLVRTFTPAQAAFRAAPDEWSIAENLEHLVVAEQGSINRVSPAVHGLDPRDVVTPHPISGPWDADQWLAFVRFHLVLHRAQIESVIREAAFPRS